MSKEKNLSNGTLRLIVFLIVIIGAIGGIVLKYGEVKANTKGVKENKTRIGEMEEGQEELLELMHKFDKNQGLIMYKLEIVEVPE